MDIQESVRALFTISADMSWTLREPLHIVSLQCITHLCNVSHGDFPTAAAGAATSDIIEQYVSTIKTLREVDPTGQSVHAVLSVDAQ